MVFVPAALAAAQAILKSPLLGDAAGAVRARGLEKAWGDVEALFAVNVSAQEANRLMSDYALKHGLEIKTEAVTSAVEFPGVALDADGGAIPVMHTDEGFKLLYRYPNPIELEKIAERLLGEFPRGLRTPAGLVIANPAFASDPHLQALFGPELYHGAVMWSMQQAIIARGLRRQLARNDLPPTTRAAVEKAELKLWSTVLANPELQGMELWTWETQGGVVKPIPFGQAGHSSESNANQLWSHIWLGLEPPPGL